MSGQLQELWQLVVAYARQETLEPLKGLGRFLAMGLLASLFVSIGLFLALLGFLRVLQTETGSALDGGWSWVPYLLTFLAALCACVAAVAGRNRSRGERV